MYVTLVLLSTLCSWNCDKYGFFFSFCVPVLYYVCLSVRFFVCLFVCLHHWPVMSESNSNCLYVKVRPDCALLGYFVLQLCSMCCFWHCSRQWDSCYCLWFLVYLFRFNTSDHPWWLLLWVGCCHLHVPMWCSWCQLRGCVYCVM